MDLTANMVKPVHQSAYGYDCCGMWNKCESWSNTVIQWYSVERCPLEDHNNRQCMIKYRPNCNFQYASWEHRRHLWMTQRDDWTMHWKWNVDILIWMTHQLTIYKFTSLTYPNQNPYDVLIVIKYERNRSHSTLGMHCRRVLNTMVNICIWWTLYRYKKLFLTWSSSPFLLCHKFWSHLNLDQYEMRLSRLNLNG